MEVSNQYDMEVYNHWYRTNGYLGTRKKITYCMDTWPVSYTGHRVKGWSRKTSKSKIVSQTGSVHVNMMEHSKCSIRDPVPQPTNTAWSRRSGSIIVDSSEWVKSVMMMEVERLLAAGTECCSRCIATSSCKVKFIHPILSTCLQETYIGDRK